MEQERMARENEEKERAEKAKKIKEQFDDPNKQWEKDKTDLEKLAREALAKEDKRAGKPLVSSGEKTKGGNVKIPEGRAGEQ
jgi:mannan polymerase II complex ANP1 subunit